MWESKVFNYQEMNSLFSLSLSFVILLLSVINGYFIAYPLLVSLFLIIITFSRQGFSIRALIALGFASSP